MAASGDRRYPVTQNERWIVIAFGAGLIIGEYIYSLPGYKG
jgi:hypothetical protein